jgi:GABA(A) receptor-associated protein
MEDTNRLLVESRNIRNKYKDRIPVLLRSDSIKLDRYKYLVPSDITLSQFSLILRKRTKLDPKEAIFYLINDTSPPSNETMNNLYLFYADEQTEILIIDIHKENTFGTKLGCV